MTDASASLSPLCSNELSAAAARDVCAAIKRSDADWRRRYPIFNNQDAIGLAIWAGSLASMAFIALAYLSDVLSPWLTVFLMAIPLSLLHELEHDLIHNLYFRSSSLIQDVMFFGIWVAKLHASPWIRRELHLRHHLLSGQSGDAEERFFGVGLPLGLKRLALTVHPAAGVLVTEDIRREIKELDISRVYRTSGPPIFMFVVLLNLALCYRGHLQLFGVLPFFLPSSLWPFVRDATILLCLPNIVRHVSFVLTSNYSHYFGDIPEHDVFYQNQIVDSWLLLPFQLFSFNFGSTHIVHHYVPGQPFYLRQLSGIDVKRQMLRSGIRRNDFGMVARLNNYQMDSSVQTNVTHYLLGVFWFASIAVFGVFAFIIADVMVCQRILQLTLPSLFSTNTAQPSQNQSKVDPQPSIHVPTTAEMQALADTLLFNTKESEETSTQKPQSKPLTPTPAPPQWSQAQQAGVSPVHVVNGAFVSVGSVFTAQITVSNDGHTHHAVRSSFLLIPPVV